MGLLTLASVRTTKGTVRIDKQGNLHIPGRITVVPPEAVVSIDVEDGEALSTRVTAARVLALGVFALAAKKRTGGEKYISIETDDDFIVMEVERKHTGDAVRFAAQVRRFIKRH